MTILVIVCCLVTDYALTELPYDSEMDKARALVDNLCNAVVAALCYIAESELTAFYKEKCNSNKTHRPPSELTNLCAAALCALLSAALDIDQYIATRSFDCEVCTVCYEHY